MSKYILVKVSISLIIFIISFEAFADNISYQYKNPFNPTKMIVLDLEQKRITVGDIGASISICGRNDLYICFANNYIKFSVPTKGIKYKDKWEFEGVEFINTGLRKINFLGSSTDVYGIEADLHDVTYRYLYSEQYGLVAIGIFHINTDEGQIYLLTGVYGFL